MDQHLQMLRGCGLRISGENMEPDLRNCTMICEDNLKADILKAYELLQLQCLEVYHRIDFNNPAHSVMAASKCKESRLPTLKITAKRPLMKMVEDGKTTLIAHTTTPSRKSKRWKRRDSRSLPPMRKRKTPHMCHERMIYKFILFNLVLSKTHQFSRRYTNALLMPLLA